MKETPFFDPHQIPLARPWLGDDEVGAAAEVVRSGQLCQGPRTAAFEEAFAAAVEARHAIAVSSGSTALLVALQALGVKEGDEVIVPNMTFISSATCASLLGARPRLCDISLTDYNISVDAIEPLITARTKAIVPVHYAGQAADMAPILELARAHDLRVLEDAAEAHLSRYRGGAFAGTIGDAGIFSFTPTKLMTTGEGGMIVTNDDDVARRCRHIRNFGDHGKFQWDSLGFNYRLNEVASAIGLVQLGKLKRIVAERRRKARRFDEAFRGEAEIVIPWTRTCEDTNYQLYTIRLILDRLDIDRDGVLQALAAEGVSSRLYYPPLHRQGVFRSLSPRDADFPNTNEFAASALSLPIFTAMTDEEQDRVIGAVLDVVRAHRR